MAENFFVFATSEVKEDTMSLMLGCLAAAPACTASFPATTAVQVRKSLFPLEQLLLT